VLYAHEERYERVQVDRRFNVSIKTHPLENDRVDEIYEMFIEVCL